MTTATAPRTFVNRIGYLTTCVLPASILNADPTSTEDTSSLRGDASQDGLSYIQVKRLLEDGIYLARVAASPDRVAHGYTILLSEQDLYYALPWDSRLSQFLSNAQNKQPERILALLHAHAAEVRPLSKMSAPASQGAVPPQPVAATMVSFAGKNAQTIEISADDLQETLGLSLADTARDTTTHIAQKSTYRMQQAFLRVAIDDLVKQFYQEQDRTYALDIIHAKCVLIATIQRWHRRTRQQVVNAVVAFDEHAQHILWQLTIGVPRSADLAA